MFARLRELTDSLPLQVAISIVGVWAISLWNCAQIEISHTPIIYLLGLVGWQTWLYTGLFITAHDGMHGSIYPLPLVNRSIGQLCLWLYAGFDYSQLLAKHQLHHQHPASDRDPDFHHGKAAHFWGWYGHFVCEHVSWRQLLNLVVMFCIYATICHFPTFNILLFWVTPSLLSSSQLFYFGTFLPHREPPDGYTNPHRATTIDRSTWWSLITCYHFGYHYEHHDSPQTPWWKLREGE